MFFIKKFFKKRKLRDNNNLLFIKQEIMNKVSESNIDMFLRLMDMGEVLGAKAEKKMRGKLNAVSESSLRSVNGEYKRICNIIFHVREEMQPLFYNRRLEIFKYTNDILNEIERKEEQDYIELNCRGIEREILDKYFKQVHNDKNPETFYAQYLSNYKKTDDGEEVKEVEEISTETVVEEYDVREEAQGFEEDDDAGTAEEESLVGLKSVLNQ